jgi:hypothetical protein
MSRGKMYIKGFGDRCCVAGIEYSGILPIR